MRLARENREDSEKNEIPLSLSDLRAEMCSDLAFVSREKRRRNLPERLRVRPSVDGRLKARIDGELVVEGDAAVDFSAVVCGLGQKGATSWCTVFG